MKLIAHGVLRALGVLPGMIGILNSTYGAEHSGWYKGPGRAAWVLNAAQGGQEWGLPDQVASEGLAS